MPYPSPTLFPGPTIFPGTTVAVPVASDYPAGVTLSLIYPGGQEPNSHLGLTIVDNRYGLDLD